MFAETADEYAYEKRESRTGMLLAFLPLGNKLSSSLGKLAAGVVVQWVALPVGQKASAVDPDALTQLGVAAVSVTTVAGLIAIGFYSRYHLPRARHAEILGGLSAMRAQHAAATRNTAGGPT
jgi:Na+/melibiose symporter-like transporter